VTDARGRDAGAKVWNVGFDMSGGDARFATLYGGLVNGEAGFSGKDDPVGATGIFQFDPRFGEGQHFKEWLNANGHPADDAETRRQAQNIDLVSQYYLPYIKEAYDDAVARGVTNENQLMEAMVTGNSSRGYGHNSGAKGTRYMNNYYQGLQEFKEGKFRLLNPSRW